MAAQVYAGLGWQGPELLLLLATLQQAGALPESLRCQAADLILQDVERFKEQVPQLASLFATASPYQHQLLFEALAASAEQQA
ncbi:hypothetical protein HaLaN_10005, partial [Haematococcus lacustris]